MKPKLMIIGHARHGKDTVGSILNLLYDLKFESSSHFVAERAVKPYLARMGITYSNSTAMYEDRVNHRAEWHKAIAVYNREDPAKLGMELFAQYDVYCGIRSRIELQHLRLRNAFDQVWWVDAGLRMPLEPENSMKLHINDAEVIINNNGTKQFLRENVMFAYRLLNAKLNKQ